VGREQVPVDHLRDLDQCDAQKPGLGFPIARAVVVFCLATGAALDAALGRYRGKRTGEAAPLRELADALEPGDVVLGDRSFGSFFDLALWQTRGVDVVVRLHQARRADFRAGRRLGPGDHVVRWAKPDRPEWLDAATYAALPEALAVREVAVRVPQPGFRTRRLVVATTLWDAGRYPAGALAALYRARWHAELDLRSLKVTLGLDVLRCRMPAMVRKEFWAHLLAYNLIRAVMARAAQDLGCPPRELSFTGAWQAVRAFGERLLGAGAAQAEELHGWLLIVVGSQQVGDRPDRVEPRARKRRPKHGAFLSQSRDQPRAELRNGVRA
jgi:Transposase DDE domain